MMVDGEELETRWKIWHLIENFLGPSLTLRETGW